MPSNVLLFWYAFRFHPFELLPAVFFVWVNCFGIIAPVQAWSFANSLFDTRQAKRLFGLIGAGASFGAITGGVLARYLVEPVGGAVNMLLVLAALIMLAAVIVAVANTRIHRKIVTRLMPQSREPIRDAMRQIAGSPYLRLMTALVFLVAIVTQWTAFQLSLVADERFAGDADAITRFFGTFNYTLGAISFLLQLLVTGPALRRFGIAVTVLILPLSLGFGTALIWLAPGLWSVLLTNAFDQGFRFSIDKSSYELLYLPIPPAQRIPVKNAIDIVVNRVADGVRRVAARARDARALPWIPGLGSRPARHRRDQYGLHRDVGGRRVAAANGVRPDHPREHPSPSSRYRARGVDDDRKIGGRSAAGEAGGGRCVGSALCARAARGAADAELAAGAARRCCSTPRPTSGGARCRCLRAAGDREIGADGRSSCSRIRTSAFAPRRSSI